MLAEMAVKSGLTPKECEAAVQAFRKTVLEETARGGRITIRGFGTFRSALRSARLAHNPATGAKVQLDDRRVLTFRPVTKLPL